MSLKLFFFLIKLNLISLGFTCRMNKKKLNRDIIEAPYSTPGPKSYNYCSQLISVE